MNFAPALLLGGYGSLGSRIARTLRQLHPDLPLTITGRDLGKASALAERIDNSAPAIVDVSRADLGLPREKQYSIVVTALRDHSLNTLHFAQARGIPYMALSDAVFEIGPLAVGFAHKPTAAPVVLVGHSIGAVPTLTALHCARAFTRIDAIEIGLVLDPRDPFGPASAADMENIVTNGPAPLIVQDGRWRWLGKELATREFAGVDGSRHVGQAVGLADLLSLTRSGATSIRVDVAGSPSASSRAGGAPAHEVIIEIVGEHAGRGQGRFRYEIVDPQGYAALSARGIAIIADTLLRQAPGPGLYLPESLVDPGDFVRRLAGLGLDVRAA